ncbi:Ig-like domain repeat protein [Isosphaeraceae bacterium EP7]
MMRLFLGMFDDRQTPRPTRRRRRATPTVGFRPHHETLEVRITPATVTWTGAVSTLWSNTANWDTAAVPVAGDDLVFPSGTGRQNLTNDLTAGLSFNSITIHNVYTLSGAAITLAGDLNIPNANGVASYNLPTTMTTGVINTTSALGGVSLGGIISGSAGITKTGPGILYIGGDTSNTYTGTTTIVSGPAGLTKSGMPGQTVTSINGDLVIGAGASLTSYYSDQIADTSTITIGLGGTLAFDDFGGQVTEQVKSLSMTGATVATGTGSLALNDRIDVLASAQSSTISGALAMIKVTPEIAVADGAADDDLVISASFFNPNGPVTKTGVGTELISSSNTTFNNTVVAGGTLAISNGGALGGVSSTATIWTGATLDLRGTMTVAPAVSTSASGSGAAARILASSGNTKMNGNFGLGATLNFEVADGLNLLLSGQNVAETVLGASVTKTGTGLLSYQVNSTYTGGTTIEAGTLQSRGSSALSTSGVVTVEGGATLDFFDAVGMNMGLASMGIPSGGLNLQGSGVGGTAGALSKSTGIGSIMLVGGAVNLVDDATVRVDGGDLRFQQATTGSNVLTKQGTGILAFMVANNGLSKAVVEEGSLFVLDLNTFNVELSGVGSTLGGFGSVGFVTSAGGSMAAGLDMAGALATTGLTLDGSSTFDVDIDGNVPGNSAGMSGFYDQTTVNGVVNLGGATLNLNVTNNYTPTYGGTLTLIENDGGDLVVGTFAGLAEGSSITAGGKNFTISYLGGTGNDVVLNCILSTTTSVTSSSNPSNNGSAITLSASVSTSFGMASGTVTFFDGSTQIGSPVTLVSGAGSIGYSPGVGVHNITAVYSGDLFFFGSTSTNLVQNVNGEATTTALAATTATVFGQSATFTAFVTSTTAGTITGTVTFFADGVSMGSGTVTSGQASISTASLVVGTYAITATYNGDSTYSAGNTASSVSQLVNQANTSVSVVVSANPAAPSTPVTFTATVSATSPGAGSPTGLMSFFAGSTNLGSVAIVNNVASLTTSLLTLGSHAMTISYLGDSNFNASPMNTFTQVIANTAATTTILTATSATVYGQQAVITAQVTSATSGTITGTMTFYAGGVVIGTGPVIMGQTSISTAILAAGSHTITASYSGDANYSSGSTATPVTQLVNKASTNLSFASSANPSLFGQSVTYTATISAVSPGSGMPTGTVTFYSDGVSIGTNLVSSGSIATLVVSSLGVGSHAITALYSGDGNFSSSSTAQAITQVVTASATSTILTSNLASTVYGQQITFNAAVSAISPGSGLATGTVTFYSDGVSIGAGTLSAGVATLQISTLPAGSHSITATYSGDPSFSMSSSAGLSLSVSQVATGAVLSLQGPTVSGQYATYVVTVGSVSGAPMPTGNATVTLGSTVLGTSPLDSSGLAYFVLAIADVGSLNLTGHYLGDANHSPITTADQTQVVSFASASVVIVASSTSVIGLPVSFSANVNAIAPGGGTIGGSVLFYDGSTPIGTGNVVNGVASFSAVLSPGLHAIAAAFQGDAHFAYAAAASPALIDSVLGATTTTLTMPGASANGQTITFTATVAAPGYTPEGTVMFYANGTPIGPGTLSGGVATFTTNGLPAANYAITAAFLGSANFAGSTSAAGTQVISQAGANLTMTQSAASVSFAQPVTFSVNVGAVAPGAGVPTGTVTFTENGTVVAVVNLVNGSGTFVASALSVGTRTIVATYSGNSSFIALNTATATVQVTQSATITTVAPAPTGPVLTVRVSSSPTSLAIPTGSVFIFLDGVVQGIATLTGGTYSWTIDPLKLAKGQKYTATYGGDVNFKSSSGSYIH